MRRFEVFEEVILGVNDFDEAIFDAAPDCEELADSEDIIKKALTGERLPGEVTPHPDSLEKRASGRKITYKVETVDGLRMRVGYDEKGNEVSAFILDVDDEPAEPPVRPHEASEGY